MLATTPTSASLRVCRVSRVQHQESAALVQRSRILGIGGVLVVLAVIGHACGDDTPPATTAKPSSTSLATVPDTAMALTTSTASATTVPPRPAPEQALIAASHTQTLYFGRTTSKNAEVHLKDMPDPKPIEVHPNPPDIGNHPSVPDTNNGNDHHSHGKHGESRFCRRHRWC